MGVAIRPFGGQPDADDLRCSRGACRHVLLQPANDRKGQCLWPVGRSHGNRRQGVDPGASDNGVRIGEEEQAGHYIDKQNFDLEIVPRKDEGISDQNLAVRLQAVGALQQYASALAAASDRKTAVELENASAALGLAATSAASIAFPPGAPIIGPAIKVASRSIGLALGNAYAGEIQMIVRSRDADVAMLSQLLAEDMRKVAGQLGTQAKEFRIVRKIVLVEIRADHKVDSLRLYDEYKRARADYETITALKAAADRAPKVLEAMARAHHELAVGSPGAKDSLNTFIGLTEDLTGLATAIRKSGGA